MENGASLCVHGVTLIYLDEYLLGDVQSILMLSRQRLMVDLSRIATYQLYALLTIQLLHLLGGCYSPSSSKWRFWVKEDGVYYQSSYPNKIYDFEQGLLIGK